VHNGALARQGDAKVLKVDAGKLVYNSIGLKNGQVFYNTITTPRGGQYEVTLADGTIVWLNAASSLHFPTAFIGKERTVSLTGEGYFEVAKNKSMPFHVEVNGMDVMVTGTHFDVMAYANEENTKTTLLEGRVMVIPANGKEQILLPGRQAVLNNEAHDIKMINADLDQVMAWKNGYFRFRETNIRDVMKQLERWYDVDVEYKTTRSDQDYTGMMPRMQNASSLLQTLELTGTVHFKIEGKKIIVLP
jgi:ferric-dicitrate binding protein FerR (iron transport regulator)